MTAIAGIGESAYSRSKDRPATDLGLTLAAAMAALDDAGLSTDDVDGLVAPYMGATAEELIGNLGLGSIRYVTQVMLGGASPVAAVGYAAAAVASGQAQVVLVPVGWAGYSGRRARALAADAAITSYRKAVRDLYGPHGANSPSQVYAQMAKRHMLEFGTSPEALGTVAVTTRAHAQRQTNALMREPLTLAEHHASRWIVEPYRLLDCCLETDAGAAVVVTAADHPMRHRPVLIAGCADARPSEPMDMYNRRDFFEIGLTTAAPRAYEQAGLGPEDADFAQVYDCFTFEVIQQLEEAGFCARGEGGEFVLGGETALDGRLPVNTHGGLLSQAHALGMNHVVEAVRQLRGEAANQVQGARVGVVTGWGDLGDGSIAILRSDA
jgi:acetyl-CoA acetyltransferase